MLRNRSAILANREIAAATFGAIDVASSRCNLLQAAELAPAVEVTILAGGRKL